MIFRKKNNRKIDKYSPITDLQQRPRKFWFATTTGMSCGLKYNTQKKLISVIWQQKVEVYP